MLARLVSQAERQRGSRQAEALGAQAHLGRRLLAGEIDGAAAGVGEGGRQLQQQRRLADAGLAADQKRGARHDAAAGDAVELGQAGGCAAPRRRASASVSNRRQPRPSSCAPGREPGEPAAASASSIIVFHSPQATHLPAQRGATAPQSLADELAAGMLWPCAGLRRRRRRR